MTSFVGKNSIQNLSDILNNENVQKALIFTGKKSYEVIKHIIESELKGIEFQYSAEMEYCAFVSGRIKQRATCRPDYVLYNLGRLYSLEIVRRKGARNRRGFRNVPNRF